MATLAELGEIAKAGTPHYLSRAGFAARKMEKAKLKRLKRQGTNPSISHKLSRNISSGLSGGAIDEAQRVMGAETIPKLAEETSTKAVAGGKQAIDEAMADWKSRLPSNKRMAAYGIGGTTAVGTGLTAPGAIMRGHDRRKRVKHDKAMLAESDRLQANRQQNAYNSMNQPQWDVMTSASRKRLRDSS